MASESCSICGEEADADEVDPHGHFSGDDEQNEDIVHLLIHGTRRDKTACGEDPDDIGGGASTHEGSVNCVRCRAAL